ncbi:hypothetical protein GW758_02065 [Candidatus Falkowbacteria bacterium]|nr:hypothetical protein [Candidatus Falkowbacteria bacterium]NCT54727.1 hypothetical protein [Candidatus Falkowbacteria bacterium]
MKKLNEKQKEILKIFVREFFYFLSILVAAFFILDIVLKGLISAYLNLNLLFLLWLIIALIDLRFKAKK